MKRIFTLLLSLTLTAGLMVGCSSGKDDSGKTDDNANKTESEAPGSKDDKLVIYGIYKAGDQTWFIDEGDAAKAKAEEMGAEFVFVDVQMNPEQCLKAVDNAIANNADGILMCIPDQTMSQAVVDKCKEANLPIVAVDDALEKDGKKLAPWVGIDGYKIGEANGEWLANYMKDNKLVEDEATGVLLLTMDTVSSCVPRTEGAEDKLLEIIPGYKRIYKGDTDGTTDKGYNAASAVITANPQIKNWMVLTANEESAVGAVRALETAGLDKTSCVVGLGAYLAKDEWKKSTDVCMKASCYFSADSIGGASAEMLINYIKNGTEMAESTAVPAIVVTPENYKEVMGDAAN